MNGVRESQTRRCRFAHITLPLLRAANPSHDPQKPPLYVGMTGLDPETRFERHKYGVKDNHYVRRYGVGLRPDLYAELNPLPYAEAQRMEWVLARELRSDGYAVWQK